MKTIFCSHIYYFFRHDMPVAHNGLNITESNNLPFVVPVFHKLPATSAGVETAGSGRLSTII